MCEFQYNIVCGIQQKRMQVSTTTLHSLKWTEDGELSSIDMDKILDALENVEKEEEKE